MGSGLGAPSASQASVQGERSWRDGLPVRLFDRTVSRALAASILSFTTGFVSASAVVSQTDPHQAPCAPIAIAAAIWRPVTMPPAARIGVVSPIASSAAATSGTSTIVATSPQ